MRAQQAGESALLLLDVSREDFIAMKLFAHGPQHIGDAELALNAAGANLWMCRFSSDWRSVTAPRRE